MNVRILTIARSVGVIGATGALMLGATFAATTTNSVTASGTVAVSNNLSISTETAGTYGPTVTGIAFSVHPGSPTPEKKHLFIKTSEPDSSVALSGTIKSWGTTIGAQNANLTAHFQLGSGGVKDVKFSDLGTSDVSLADLGWIAGLNVSNDLSVWVTATSTTPEFSPDAFTLQLTGTSNGSI